MGYGICLVKAEKDVIEPVENMVFGGLWYQFYLKPVF